VNPIATILAAMMMVDWLGEQPTAQAIHRAVAQVVAQGQVRTYDMGGSASTLDVAHAVAATLGA
jgi:3-isopropylmalate dehydrogenase